MAAEILRSVAGLDEIAEGERRFGTPDGLVVGVGGQEQDHDAGRLVDPARGLDAIHGALEVDVHEHQIGTPVEGDGDGRLATRRDVHDLVAQLFELVLQTERDGSSSTTNTFTASFMVQCLPLPWNGILF